MNDDLKANLTQFFIYMTEFMLENDLTFEMNNQEKNLTEKKVIKKKGRILEEECLIILTQRGWDTHTTPITGDQGADLIATRGPIKLIIQCKDYKSNVGNSAVQEVHAAKSYFEGNLAAIVARKGYTKAAKSLAKSLDVMLLTIEQLDEF